MPASKNQPRVAQGGRYPYSMSVTLKVILFAAFAVALWLFARWRSPRPDFPPLNTAPDDPLLLKAVEKPKATLDEFKRLLEEAKKRILREQ